jgi:hypothetical protein
MESFLRIVLIVGIPVYAVFAWWQKFLTLRRVIFLIALEVGVASTYTFSKTGERVGTIAGVVILCLNLIPTLMRWIKRHREDADFPQSLQ